MAATGAATHDREMVPDDLATTVGEKGRTAGETCALLLAALGRRTPSSEAVCKHAEDHRGAAAAGRLATQARG